MHRIGGLEKQDGTGDVSYDPENHQRMVQRRAQKVANIATEIDLVTVDGPASGELLVLTWGGTYGAARTAVVQAQAEGCSVAHAHLRWLNPFPRNLGEMLGHYRQVLIPELNLGQLKMLIRARYLIDAQGLSKVKGKPFSVQEIRDEIHRLAVGPTQNLQPR
jgi:2-oxoglutarate ferredoxin oxidoreductase subunit alpha